MPLPLLTFDIDQTSEIGSEFRPSLELYLPNPSQLGLAHLPEHFGRKWALASVLLTQTDQWFSRKSDRSIFGNVQLEQFCPNRLCLLKRQKAFQQALNKDQDLVPIQFRFCRSTVYSIRCFTRPSSEFLTPVVEFEAPRSVNVGH